MDSKPLIRILCIVGGGVKGNIPAQFLKRMEEETGHSIYDSFDMFGGTSIGSIIIGGISYCKIDGEEMSDVLFDIHNAQNIMPRTWMDKIFGSFQNRPLYDGKGKIDILNKYLGDKKMSDTKKPTIITSFNLSSCKPKMWKSWKPKDSDILVKNAIDMSSAAPGYFPNVDFDLQQNGNHIWGIDGALCANDPTDCVYADALELFGADSDIRILTLGTGKDKNKINLGPESKNWGFIQWATEGNILNLLMEGSQNCTSYRMKQFTEALGHRYMIINDCIENTKLDDTSPKNIQSLKDTGDKWWDKYGKDVLKFLDFKDNI